MRAGPAIALVSLLALSSASGLSLSAQAIIPRVDVDEALRHLVKKANPVVPAAAAAAGIGGDVVTEAIIRLDGTVESVRVLAGPAELHQAAIAAVKQWTFQPFLQNGKPARVLAILDVRFPDSREQKERRAASQQIEEMIRSTPPTSTPRRPTTALRRIGSLSCICADAAVVSDGQVTTLAKTIPSSVRAWFIEAADPSWAMVYVVASRAGPDYRIGDVGLISGAGPGGSSQLRYSGGPATASWIQLNRETMPASHGDPYWPMLIGWSVASGPFSEAATVELVKTAVVEAKPLRVARLSHSGSFDVVVELDDPASALPRFLTYRREGSGWIVIRRQ